MSLLRSTNALLAASLVVFLVGCGSSQPATQKGAGKPAAKKADPLDMAADLLRKSSVAANFRAALTDLNALLAKPEQRERLTFSKEDRETIAKHYRLNADEFTEIESATFRLLDAHHLEHCYLMRDAVRALELEGRPPLTQANLCFEWACRQVRSREGSPEVLPPVYVLQRASGNSLERILVFLGLLHQLQLDGCIVKVGDDANPVYLAGARIGDDKNAEIYLFDARLGLAVAGPAGKTATLTDLRKHPELASLKSVGEPQVLLAAPLSAIAPRMKVLEDWLAPQDRVMLATHPVKTLERLSAASGTTASVWRPVSPHLSLRTFLPPEEGGTDQSGWLRIFPRLIVPVSAIRHHFIDWKLTEFIPDAEARMLILTAMLFKQYAEIPQDMLVRGRYDFLSKRLNALRTVFEDLEFAGAADFKQQLAEWLDDVKQAFLQAGKGGDAGVSRLFNEDQFLIELLQNPDDRDPRRFQRGRLTLFLLSAARDSIVPDMSYRQALSWQEKAERAQVAQAAGDARSAWINAGDWWRKFAERTTLSPALIRPKLEPIRRRWNPNNPEISISLWEQLARDIHYAALARFYQARAWAHLDKDKAATARTILENLQSELELLKKDSELTKDLAFCLEQARALPNPPAAARLQALTTDLFGDSGALHWLRVRAQLQLKSF